MDLKNLINSDANPSARFQQNTLYPQSFFNNIPNASSTPPPTQPIPLVYSVHSSPASSSLSTPASSSPISSQQSENEKFASIFESALAKAKARKRKQPEQPILLDDDDEVVEVFRSATPTHMFQSSQSGTVQHLTLESGKRSLNSIISEHQRLANNHIYSALGSAKTKSQKLNPSPSAPTATAPQNTPPSNEAQNKLIGTMKTLVVDFNSSNYSAAQIASGQANPKAILRVRLTPHHSEKNVLEVRSREGLNLGFVRNLGTFTQVLQKCAAFAFVQKPSKFNVYSAELALQIYTSEKMLNLIIDQAFLCARTNTDVTFEVNRDIYQPEVTIVSETRQSPYSVDSPIQNKPSQLSSTSSSMSSYDRKEDLVVQKAQIDAVYNSLLSAVDYPEIDPAPNIKSVLFPHQKQALYFMMKREELVDFSNQDPSSSFWKRKVENGKEKYVNLITMEPLDKGKPEQVRGGILADDMGLGKTLEVISLIATSKHYQITGAKLPQLPSTQSVGLSEEDDDVVVVSDSSAPISPYRSILPSISNLTSTNLDFTNSQSPFLKETISQNVSSGVFGNANYSSPIAAMLNDSSQSALKYPNPNGLYGPPIETSTNNVNESSELYTPTTPSRATLIVCPLTVMDNWQEQINAHMDKTKANGKWNVYVYHGPSRIQDPVKLAEKDIVITSYNVIATEFSKDLKNSEKKEKPANPLSFGKKDKNDDVQKITKPTSTLQLIYWDRIILDEAHGIKDPTTVQSRACCQLHARRRWCLTGTPIQNKLDDLYALVKFLRISPFDKRNNWNNYISKPIKFNSGVIGDAKSGMTIGISRLQTLMKLITLRRLKSDVSVDGTPILSLPPRIDQTVMLELPASERCKYELMDSRARNEFQHLANEGTVLKNYAHVLELLLRLRQFCAHPSLLPLSMQEDESEFTPKRAKRIYLLMKTSDELYCCQCNSNIDDSEKPEKEPPQRRVISKCGHLFCGSCRDSLVVFCSARDMMMRAQCDVNSRSSIQCPVCQSNLHPDVDMLKVEESEEVEEEEITQVENHEAGESFRSVKVERLLEDLATVKENDSRTGEVTKCVVFSQWTGMLDLIQDALNKAKFTFVRLDGKMARQDRTTSLDTFKSSSAVTILLLSLKVGGVGLNLTEASRVYIMEPYWNPAIEQQAIDRIHRLGQKKQVYCIRYLINNSVEDRLVEMQKRKMELVRMTFNEEETNSGEEDVGAVQSGGSKGKKRIVVGNSEQERIQQQQERINDLNMLLGSGI